jgi:hypothetical protein
MSYQSSPTGYCNCPTDTVGRPLHNIGCIWRTMVPAPQTPSLMLVLRFSGGEEITAGMPSPLTDDEIERAIPELTRRFLKMVRQDHRITTL